MNESAMKCVMVIDAELPIGVIANTSAILGVTLGKHISNVVGEDVTDTEKQIHLGIISIPIVMLKGSAESLKKLRKQLYDSYFSDLVTADFSDVAQSCNVYEDYIDKALSAPEYTYLGLAIYGDKRKVNKLTGSMPLLK